MILPIYTYGQPVLKRVAQDIPKDYADLKDLISNMWETMYNAKGVGLAAPQVGRSIRLFMIDTEQLEGDDDEPNFKGIKRAFINAHIVEETGDRLESILAEKGMNLFARINHAQGAANAGLELGPTELFIFGNPKVGTPLMRCQRCSVFCRIACSHCGIHRSQLCILGRRCFIDHRCGLSIYETDHLVAAILLGSRFLLGFAFGLGSSKG